MPDPLYRSTSTIWRALRLAITFGYFKLKHPRTRLVLKTSSGIGQFNQPILIDVLLGQKHGGRFLDIGANHPVNNNNTHYFEKEREYTGLAFDPLNSYIDLWKTQRPRTEFFQCALGSKPGKAVFHEAENTEGWEDQLSYVENVLNEASLGKTDNPSTEGPGRRVIDILPLRHFDIGPVDFASIDVEGFEEDVLNGMLPEIRPTIVLVENCSFPVGSERIRSMMRDNGYRFHSRIRYIDDLYVLEA